MQSGPSLMGLQLHSMDHGVASARGSYERQGKAIEPTIKLGAATAAIERREQRSARAAGRDYEAATAPHALCQCAHNHSRLLAIDATCSRSLPMTGMGG